MLLVKDVEDKLCVVDINNEFETEVAVFDKAEYSENHINAYIEHVGEDYFKVYYLEIEDSSFYENVTNEEDYGYLIFNEFIRHELSSVSQFNIEHYINFESLGHDIAISESGTFTDYGYIVTC